MVVSLGKALYGSFLCLAALLMVEMHCVSCVVNSEAALGSTIFLLSRRKVFLGLEDKNYDLILQTT